MTSLHPRRSARSDNLRDDITVTRLLLPPGDGDFIRRSGAFGTAGQRDHL
jgi:hypothetical protein